MAERELHKVSPSYEALCRAVADSAQVCALLDQLPTPKRQPNLLLGAVRFLDGPVDTPARFLDFVRSQWGTVADVMLTHRTQTNEPGRCATLLPLLATLDQPVALLEVGASAGLCLYPDRYAYRYTTNGQEHLLGDSSVSFACAVTGPVPLPNRLPEVVWRAGLDLNPLYVDRDEDRRWLASLIWPEQTDRVARLNHAADLVAADPPRLVVGDLLTDLPALADEAPIEATLVVFHSAVLAYLDQDQRNRFTDVMHELQAKRDVHWISNEAPGIVEGTDIEPTPLGRFVVARNQVPVAVTAPHGQTLDWLIQSH
ncbi:MAG: DUF2332 domain-containing protein [Kineosporiaceae bacterium]|nr:DUF2332 domain-containing protein [Aeromicrobium sp.]